MKQQVQELRTKLQAGYITYTGKQLSRRQCEEYNFIQEEINAWIKADREVPEHLLNESHAKFASFCY